MKRPAAVNNVDRARRGTKRCRHSGSDGSVCESQDREMRTGVSASSDVNVAINSQRVGRMLLAGAGILMVGVLMAVHPAILQSATGSSGHGNIALGGTDIFTIVNQLLDPALWITVAIAPLAIAWGAGAMMFGGRHGPQIMGSAIV